jgi:hypothetical protein
VVTGGICAAGLIAVYLLAVWTPAGQRFEDAVLRGATGSTDGARATSALDRISAPTLILAIAVVLSIGFLRRKPLLGFLGAGVVVASVATAEVIQRSVQRPILLQHGYRREDQSFPSGHAAVAMSVMCALVMVTPYRFRGVVLLATSVGATAVEVATVSASWHRPSDAVGSDLIVLVYVCVAAAVLARYGWIAEAGASGRLARTLLATGYGGVALVALAVAVAAAGHGSAFLAGRALALCGSAAVALALLALLRGVDLSTAVSAPTKDRELAW